MMNQARWKEIAANQAHGSYMRYEAGCRCEDCAIAASLYRRDRKAARRAGLSNGFTSAAPARQHIADLRAEGITNSAISLAAELHKSMVRDIASGRKKQIREHTARVLLGVTSNMQYLNGRIPAAPTRRRLEALEAAGYSRRDIGKRLGLKDRVALATGKVVYASKARRVRALYHDLLIVPRQLKGKKFNTRSQEA